METEEQKRITALENKLVDLETSFWRKLGNGSNSVSTNIGDFAELHVKGVLRSVKLGDSIQAAIDYVNDRGGGEVRLASGTYTVADDITMYSNISLIGSGRDSTILEFSGSANGVLVVGTVGTIKKNWSIKDLTIQNSNNAAGLDIDFCDFWKIENIRVTSCDQDGARLQRSQSFVVERCRFDTNTSDGILIYSDDDSGRDMKYFTIKNTAADTNGAIGFKLSAYANTNDQIREYVFDTCIASDNTGDGFDLITTNTSSNSELGTFLNCQSFNNTGIGFDMDNMQQKVFISCMAKDNTGDGFEITSGTDSVFVACNSLDNGSNIDWDLSSSTPSHVFIGCVLNSSSSVAPSTFMPVSKQTSAELFSTRNGSPVHLRKTFRMKNGSGGDLVGGGQVVVYAADASGEVFTTTTTAGDDKVLGVLTGSAGSNNYGNVIVAGITNLLKVNGTTDIAIGDFLTTYSEAGIAAKAAAGDMVFAIALEAYTTNDSLGQIDALVVSPRLI